MFNKLVRRFYCFRHGHRFRKEDTTLGGYWIRCVDCNYLDEYLYGVHEPKGFKI